MTSVRMRFITLLLTLAACSSGGDDGTDPVTNLPQGSMSARIDGATWAASSALAATYGGGIMAIAGTDGAGQTLGFALFVSSPGTYTLANSIGTNASLTVGSAAWSAIQGRGAGSVTVNAISATGASGTFTFTLVSTGGAASKTVTEGRFDVKFP